MVRPEDEAHDVGNKKTDIAIVPLTLTARP